MVIGGEWGRGYSAGDEMMTDTGETGLVLSVEPAVAKGDEEGGGFCFVIREEIAWTI